MKNILNTKIPTIIGLLLVFGIPLMAYLFRDQTSPKISTLKSQKPIDIKFTNVSDTSFTITYLTDVSTSGAINYGDSNNLEKSETEKTNEKTDSPISKKIHSISTKDLNPSTKYHIAIISGSETFLDNTSPFEITTGETISYLSDEEININGELILPNGNSPEEAIVYLKTDGSQTLSSLTSKKGKFNFSLNKLRTEDYSSYFEIQDSTIFEIFATNGSLSSKIKLSLTSNNKIPIITLSNNYDYTQEKFSISSNSANLVNFPPITPTDENTELKIISPKGNQSYSIRKPLFKGTSLPNEKVEIIVHSEEEVTAEITADDDGNWSYQPTTNLSPGEHTITIKTRDSSGILRIITQSFTIRPAETLTATPTPSLIPTPRFTPTPTITLPTITIEPTAIPTPDITEAPISTSTLTIAPTDAPPVSPETPPEIPPTGNSQTNLIICGVILAIIGFILLKSTRGSSL